MESSEVRHLIDQGEGPTVEFKEDFTTAIAREIVAFANGSGGVILVGVADDGTPVGVDDPRRIADRVMGLCRTGIKPALTPQTEVVTGEGKTLLLIRVPEGTQKPYTANDICYVRAGATTRRARPDELRRLSLESSYTEYERTPVAESSLEDLNLARLQAYIERRAPGAIQINGLRPSDVAVSWGLARREAGRVVPTVAGLILFGLDPQRERPQWGLGAVRIHGTELTDPIVDRADLEGTADRLIEQALAFVRRNMRVAALFEEDTSARRRDLPEYPLGAVREVLTNAVAHRDYSSTGRILLRIFTDRLEVTNPGGLPPDLRLEEITQRGGASYPRNPIIARVLREWGYMEEVGRGLIRIRREMEALGSAPPRFDANRVRFTVVLPSRHRKGSF